VRDKDEFIEVYDRIRSRIADEHGYFGARMGWLLAFQTLLVGIYKWAGPELGRDKLLYMVILPGIAISVVVLFCVLCAVLTVFKLLKREPELFAAGDLEKEDLRRLLDLDRPWAVSHLSVWAYLFIPGAYLVGWALVWRGGIAL
jgi:hypothetical protein